MTHPGKMVTVRVDANQLYQTIDGFGVNINAKCWSPALMPAMDLLLNDLGAKLFRVDIWGKSNWLDPTGEIGPNALRPDHQARVLGGEIFARGWEMIRWLNSKGIQPCLTASGVPPRWMLGPDGKTLIDQDGFSEMMASMLDWAKNKEKLNIRLFSPLNETDRGIPEGPSLGQDPYVRVCEKLVERLDARGLRDIQLVVAEQANFNASYLNAVVRSEKLRGRIGVLGMHTYMDVSPASYKEVVGAHTASKNSMMRLWMTEYGDLEQSGEREWYVAWAMTTRLFDLLEAGFHAALAWDAFDNYHDHDESWSIYGLLRAGLHQYTPKKRYYASKQVYRYVRPGDQRIGITSDTPGLRVLAFANPDRTRLTIVGLNENPTPARLNLQIRGLPDALNMSSVDYYRTSETENCQLIARLPMHGPNAPFNGIDALVPPASMFTLTTSI